MRYIRCVVGKLTEGQQESSAGVSLRRSYENTTSIFCMKSGFPSPSYTALDYINPSAHIIYTGHATLTTPTALQNQHHGI